MGQNKVHVHPWMIDKVGFSQLSNQLHVHVQKEDDICFSAS